jgi:hypothetical protein
LSFVYRSPMSLFQKLNLPQFELKIKEEEGKKLIFDSIRKNYFLLTPEEWVRQHFLNLLVNHYQYPKALIKVETGLRYNKLLKRSDIIIFDREGKSFLLVECKSADQKINQASFDQAAMYNMTIKAKYIALTNGLKTFCCRIDQESRQYEFIPDLPPLPDQN